VSKGRGAGREGGREGRARGNENSPVESELPALPQPSEKVSRCPKGEGHPSSEPESEKRARREREGEGEMDVGRRKWSKT